VLRVHVRFLENGRAAAHPYRVAIRNFSQLREGVKKLKSGFTAGL